MPRRDWLFFLFIYFHTEVRKAIRSMNLLSTFVFPFVSMCMCVRVRVSLRVWLLQLFFFSFVYCSVASSSLPSFGSPNFLLSHNNTLSDFLFVKIILPPFYLAFPVFLSLLVALYFFYSVFPPTRSFRVTKKIIRRHVRVWGIERYEEEGFEGLGGRRVAER